MPTAILSALIPIIEEVAKNLPADIAIVKKVADGIKSAIEGLFASGEIDATAQNVLHAWTDARMAAATSGTYPDYWKKSTEV